MAVNWVTAVESDTVMRIQFSRVGLRAGGLGGGRAGREGVGNILYQYELSPRCLSVMRAEEREKARR